MFYNYRSDISVRIRRRFFVLIGVALFVGGCRKQLQLDQPYNALTAGKVFADSADAASAVSGLYSSFINTGQSLQITDGAATLYLGLSSDELVNFSSDDAAIVQFHTNTLQPSNSYITTTLWANVYSMIYTTNALIEGVQSSSTIRSSFKDEVTGEAKFFRAFLYFYLVNLYDQIPLVITTDYKSNAVAQRASSDKVYAQIVSDLKDAQNLLPGDYSFGGGEKIRANKWAATALLARVYLYTGQWQDAITQASSIIDPQNFKLVDNPDDVFKSNSQEAILQLQINSSINTGIFNATPEGIALIAINPYPPYYYIDSSLQNAFEPNDLRKVSWLDSTVYDGTAYYYPYKYKIGPLDAAPNGPTTEYYTLLRSAEQYFIRAEAKAYLNTDIPGAISDINIVRKRAGLDDLANSLSQAQVLSAVAQERRIEFFAELGHRWLDLKRTGQANAVLSIKKSKWQNYQQLYPIPASELASAPSLTQNQGYH